MRFTLELSARFLDPLYHQFQFVHDRLLTQISQIFNLFRLSTAQSITITKKVSNEARASRETTHFFHGRYGFAVLLLAELKATFMSVPQLKSTQRLPI